MTILEDGQVYHGPGTKTQQHVHPNHSYSNTHYSRPQHHPYAGSSDLGRAPTHSSSGPSNYLAYHDGGSSAAFSTDNLLHYSLREAPPSTAFEANAQRERGESPKRSGLVSMLSWHLRGGRARLLLLLVGVTIIVLL